VALLSGRVAAVLLTAIPAGLLCVACEDRRGLEALALELYDAPVTCDLARDACAPTDPALARGRAWMPELLRGRAHVRDRGGAEGGYLYLQFTRASGVVAILEAEVPGVGEQGSGPLTYREFLDGALVFRADRVTGRIEIPAPMLAQDPGEACGLGRAELRFSAHGVDGKPDTADDVVRGISRARFGDAGLTSYRAPLLAVGQGLELVVLRCESAGGSGSSGESGAGAASSGGEDSADVGCGYGGDSGGWDDDDDWGDSSGGGSSGGGSSGGGGSDWEGDTWDDGGDSGWEGDTWDMNGGDPRLFGAAAPLVLLGLFGAWLRRRP